LKRGEHPAFVRSRPSKTKDHCLRTKKGIIKKTELSAFSRPRKGGILAITIREKDELIEAKLSEGKNDVILSPQRLFHPF